MAITVTHAHVSAISDDGSDVGSNAWNANHTVSGTPDPTLVDKGTVNSGTVTFSVSASSKQKLTVGGALTVAFSNWPTSGTYGEVEIQLVNASSNVTWPTISWLVGDGTNSTSFSAMGVNLAVSGTNWVVVWSTDGGSTLYGKAA